MKIRTIQGPAGKGSITVESVIADAIELRDRRALKVAPRMRGTSRKEPRDDSKDLDLGRASSTKLK